LKVLFGIINVHVLVINETTELVHYMIP